MAVSFVVFIFMSVWSLWFETYDGAIVIIQSVEDCNVWISYVFDFLAAPQYISDIKLFNIFIIKCQKKKKKMNITIMNW